MEIFNIGPMELLFIIILALVIFGPQDMVAFSRKAGRWLYKLSKSDFWQSVVGTSKEIKEFPRQIMKEAQIEESMNAIKSLKQSINAPAVPPGSAGLPAGETKSPEADTGPQVPPSENPT